MSPPWRPNERPTGLIPLIGSVRNILVPPFLSKRHYLFPFQNRVGLSLAEAAIALALTGAVCALGYVHHREGAEEASGSAAQIFWIPLILMIMYRSAVAALFGVSMERSMFWHGLFAAFAAGYSVWHGYISLFVKRAGRDGDDDRMLVLARQTVGWDAFKGNDSGVYWTGALATGFMVLTIFTSAHALRKAAPRLWLWSHHLFPVAAAVLSAIHGAGLVPAAMGLYAADRAWGYIVEAFLRHSRDTSKATAAVVEDGSLVRVSFPRSFSFAPGQFMCLYMPAVAWFEWHAFTIASAPTDDRVSFLIKADGRWTKRLLKHVAGKAQAAGAVGEEVPIGLRVHGPIGSVAIDWASGRYQAFIMFGGGIGITPLASFYRTIAEQTRRGRPVRAARLVYATRSADQAKAVLETDLALPATDTVDVEGVGGAALPGFETAIFLTKGGAIPEVSKKNDCVMASTVKWCDGRPDIASQFEDMRAKAEAAGLKRVGVLACGPDVLTQEVTSQARRHSGKVQFDVHLEHFS